MSVSCGQPLNNPNIHPPTQLATKHKDNRAIIAPRDVRLLSFPLAITTPPATLVALASQKLQID